jgi:hypothetical protein
MSGTAEHKAVVQGSAYLGTYAIDEAQRHDRFG